MTRRQGRRAATSHRRLLLLRFNYVPGLCHIIRFQITNRNAGACVLCHNRRCGRTHIFTARGAPLYPLWAIRASHGLVPLETRRTDPPRGPLDPAGAAASPRLWIRVCPGRGAATKTLDTPQTGLASLQRAGRGPP